MMYSINKKFISSLMEILKEFNYPTNKGINKFEIKFDKEDGIQKFSLFVEYEEIEGNSSMSKFIGSNYLLDFKMFKYYLHILFNINGDLYSKNIDTDTLAFLKYFEDKGYILKRFSLTDCKFLNNANVNITLAPIESNGSSISSMSSTIEIDDIPDWLNSLV